MEGRPDDLEEFFRTTLEQYMLRRKEIFTAEMYQKFVEEREINVHCDNSILHSPGRCVYCDRHPEAQVYRKMLHLKFTDEMSEDDSLLPGAERTRASAERWGGNRPGTEE